MVVLVRVPALVVALVHCLLTHVIRQQQELLSSQLLTLTFIGSVPLVFLGSARKESCDDTLCNGLNGTPLKCTITASYSSSPSPSPSGSNNTSAKTNEALMHIIIFDKANGCSENGCPALG
ncbi:MAG: hypothetical protein WA220_07930, partial [Candidatus Nitrosopolaris sp.]